MSVIFFFCVFCSTFFWFDDYYHHCNITFFYHRLPISCKTFHFLLVSRWLFAEDRDPYSNCPDGQASTLLRSCTARGVADADIPDTFNTWSVQRMGDLPLLSCFPLFQWPYPSSLFTEYSQSLIYFRCLIMAGETVSPWQWQDIAARLCAAKHLLVLWSGHLRREGYKAHAEQREDQVQEDQHRSTIELPHYWSKLNVTCLFRYISLHFFYRFPNLCYGIACTRQLFLQPCIYLVDWCSWNLLKILVYPFTNPQF